MTSSKLSSALSFATYHCISFITHSLCPTNVREKREKNTTAGADLMNIRLQELVPPFASNSHSTIVQRLRLKKTGHTAHLAVLIIGSARYC